MQGLLTLHDATVDSGGLCVIPKSHERHKELCKSVHWAKTQGDFIPVRNQELQDGGMFGDLPRVLVTAKAGDLLLWDSRTVHCNTPGLTLSDNDNVEDCAEAEDVTELLRMVCYICMTPAKLANIKTLAKRFTAFELGISTSHWPHEYHPSSGPSRQDAIDLKKVPETVKQLVGYGDKRVRSVEEGQNACSLQ